MHIEIYKKTHTFYIRHLNARLKNTIMATMLQAKSKGLEEIFSAAEAAEMLEISESELFSKMQEIGAEQIQSGRTVFYFPKGVDM